MADTRRHAGSDPVEGDGISYKGIGWFIVILTVTTVFCQVLVWGMFEWMDSRAAGRDVARSALARTQVVPTVVDGGIVGEAGRAGPTLLVEEPVVLDAYRRAEHLELTTYGWMAQEEGPVRIPIERAKELVLERGLPVR